jgi:hypothetical protein
MKTSNPYPPTITDDSSDEVVPCHDHEIWQLGYNACDKDYHNLLVKMVDIYNDLKTVRERETARKLRRVKRGKSL